MLANPYEGKFISFEGIEGSGKSTQARLLYERMGKGGFPAYLTKEPTEDGIFGKLVRFIYMCESKYGSGSLKERLPRELELCMDGREYQLLKKMADEARRRHIEKFEEIAHEIKNGNHLNLPLLLQLGMTFDGHDHAVRIYIPRLAQGIHIISDRWRLSTPAYGAGDGLDWYMLLALQSDILREDFIAPDLLILMDVPVEAGLERTRQKQGGGLQYFDTPERQAKIREAYQKIADNPAIKNKLRVAVVDGARDENTIHEEIWRMVEPLLLDA